jgi:hypothetical protein
MGALALLPILALLAFIVLWLIPWSVVRISPPPNVYLLVQRSGGRKEAPRSVRSAGISRRTRKVKIGGDQKKADIYVQGLKAVEFVVEDQKPRVVLLDAERGTLKGTFSDKGVNVIRTSDPQVTLRISADVNRLR